MDEDEDAWIDDLRGALEAAGGQEALVGGDQLTDHLDEGLFPPRRADLPPVETDWIELRDTTPVERLEIETEDPDWFVLDEASIVEEAPPAPVDDAPLGDAVSDALLPHLPDLDEHWKGVDLGDRQSLFARDGSEAGMPQPDRPIAELHWESGRKMGGLVLWIGAGILGVAVLFAVMLSLSRRGTPPDEVLIEPPEPAVDGNALGIEDDTSDEPVDDGTTELSDNGQLSSQVVNALNLVGISPDALATATEQVLVDGDATPPIPGEPRVEEAGAFVVDLDLDRFESDQTGCGSLYTVARTSISTVCDDDFLRDRRDRYLVLWANTGVGLLSEPVSNAGVQASVDLDGNGSIDVGASITTQGERPQVYTDGRDDIPTASMVIGRVAVFIVPIEDVLPQWAFATAATTTQLTDITEWQRWVIEPDGGVRVQQVEYGEDVLD